MEGQITHLQLLIAPLISFGHCVICPSIYSFWLPLWYLLVIVLSVPPFRASDCPFDIFWSLFYLSLHLQLLIAPLISFDHCVICPSIYSFWLPLWYLLIIVLSVPPFTTSDCPFDIFWSLCYLSLHLEGVNGRTDNTMTKIIPKGQSEAVNGGTDNTMIKRYQRGNQKM